MKRTASKLLTLGIVWLLATTGIVAAGDGWRTLTPPQPLPAPEAADTVQVNGAVIHYALYGSGNREAVLLLHGGLGAAEDFGGQIDALAERYKVVAIDSRGHGRSTDDDQPYGYHLMASDVMGVMDSLGIDKAAVVGWSDGGNIGLDLAIHNPDRLTRVFALGANYRTDALRPSAFSDALVGAYVGHAAAQYAKISPTPDAWESFSGKVFAMWSEQPAYTDEQLEGIAVPFAIAAGVYEEAIDEAHTKRMAELIPDAQLLLLGNASHFAHWQQVEAVNAAILEFLATE
ncbi:MAG: alpha/beta hydrolase [Boseongicola sp.]|nr:alpha/beta hydrolase [Boseongicola sp.]